MAATGPTVAGRQTALPGLVVHADWGTAERSRRLAMARRDGGRYLVSGSRPAGPPHTLLEGVRMRAGGDGAVIGFDFPIGLPRRYAELAGIDRFPDVLPSLGSGPWRAFYDPAERPEEILVTRPFYPRRPGGTSHEQLVRGLGVDAMSDLLRRCDRAHQTRRAASPIFWTLGGAQVGPAAISGWRDVLAPAVRSDPTPALWPLDGPLDALLAERPLVVVETYPAETYGQLGVVVRGKRDRAIRATVGPTLVGRAGELGIELAADARDELESGCEDDDAFDALVGLLGMLAVVLGRRPPGEPRDDAAVTSVEGWMLGQTAG